MRAFRYTAAKDWYKGNTHLHSTASDGGATFTELAAMYAGRGYHFLYRTDHRIASDVSVDPCDYPLLWLDGIELDGRDSTGAFYHVVCLGRVAGVDRETPFATALERAREQGAVLLLAHPHWTGNSLQDACRWDFHGVEIYNHVCHWINGKSYGGTHWEAMLSENPGILAVAADDAHVRPEHPGWDGGWICVNAAACTADAITDAICRGAFYSSCGPAFLAIAAKGRHVRIETSPVRFVRAVGPAYRGDRRGSFDGPLLCQAEFEIPVDWAWAYLELEDREGRRAWTNALWG